MALAVMLPEDIARVGSGLEEAECPRVLKETELRAVQRADQAESLCCHCSAGESVLDCLTAGLTLGEQSGRVENELHNDSRSGCGMIWLN